jgi:hypothetical protein
MKKIIFSLFILTHYFSFCQKTYQTAIGVKGGFPGYGSVNLKHGIGGSKYIDASMGGLGRGNYGNGFYVMGDLVFNNNLSDGFQWYYGGGVMVGFSSNSFQSNFQLAPNGVAGLEYVFEDLPLNIAIETGPYLFLLPELDFVWGGGVALRYVIK